MHINKNWIALGKLVAIAGLTTTGLVLHYDNNKLKISNEKTKEQIVNIKADTKSTIKHRKQVVQQLPNTYQTIRSDANDVIKIQKQISWIDPQVDTQKYQDLQSQLSNYLGTNMNWNAKSSWLPNKNDNIEIVFGGTADGGSTYKVGFKITDQKGNLLQFVQALYADNKFDNLTMFTTKYGNDATNASIAKKFYSFNSPAQQKAAYENAIKQQKAEQKKQAQDNINSVLKKK